MSRVQRSRPKVGQRKLGNSRRDNSLTSAHRLREGLKRNASRANVRADDWIIFNNSKEDLLDKLYFGAQ